MHCNQETTWAYIFMLAEQFNFCWSLAAISIQQMKGLLDIVVVAWLWRVKRVMRYLTLPRKIWTALLNSPAQTNIHFSAPPNNLQCGTGCMWRSLATTAINWHDPYRPCQPFHNLINFIIQTGIPDRSRQYFTMPVRQKLTFQSPTVWPFRFEHVQSCILQTRQN